MNGSISVAILGSEASFHGQAARAYFGPEVQLAGSEQFSDLLQAVHGGRADFGMLAWENSLAGLVPGNQGLLRESGLIAFADVELGISFELFGLPGSRLEQLTHVFSHPMAFKQVKGFLDTHPHWELVACSDTADAVRQVLERANPRHAALAGQAAGAQGLERLATQLQDRQDNATRFLVLRRPDSSAEGMAGQSGSGGGAEGMAGQSGSGGGAEGMAGQSGSGGGAEPGTPNPSGQQSTGRILCSFCDPPASEPWRLSGGEGLLELSRRGFSPIRVDCAPGLGQKWERIWHLEGRLREPGSLPDLLDWARSHLQGFVLSGILTG
jgi:hypothetical protein